MLSDKELNWMSENASEITAKRAEVTAEIRNFTRASDGATAKAQDGKCIEISLPNPDRNDPWFDQLPRVGCRVKILKINDFLEEA